MFWLSIIVKGVFLGLLIGILLVLLLGLVIPSIKEKNEFTSM